MPRPSTRALRLCFVLQLLLTGTLGAQAPRLVKDISSIPLSSPGAQATEVTTIGVRTFISARTQQSGYEPWITNGTKAGTKLLKDLNGGRGNSNPGQFTAVGNSVVFVGDGFLWSTDGTTNGTKQIKNLSGQPSLDVHNLTSFGNKAVFIVHRTSQSIELWTTDGTAAGTNSVTTLLTYNGSTLFPPGAFTRLGNKMLFLLVDTKRKTWLWETDGSQAGTKAISEVSPFQISEIKNKPMTVLDETARFASR